MDFFKALISAVTPKLKDFFIKSHISENRKFKDFPLKHICVTCITGVQSQSECNHYVKF